MSLMLTLNRFHTLCFYCWNDFEQVKCLLVRSLKITLTHIQDNFDITYFFKEHQQIMMQISKTLKVNIDSIPEASI